MRILKQMLNSNSLWTTARSASLATLVVGLGWSDAASADELGVRGAVSPSRGVGRFMLVVENDSWVGTDQLYTTGLFLHTEWRSPWAAKAFKHLGFGGFRLAQQDPPLLSPVTPTGAGNDRRAYLGFGVQNEMHTPATLNPCPDGSGSCSAADDWRLNYAPRDRPFAAVSAVFLTGQASYHRGAETGFLTQYRLWTRADLGTFGRDNFLGESLQRAWHVFYNEVFDSNAQNPIGWSLSTSENNPRERAVIQLGAGADLSLFRFTLGPSAHDCVNSCLAPRRIGVELDLSPHARLGYPRDELGAGATLRLGVLPPHAREPLPSNGSLQPSELYAELGWDATAVFLDATYGKDRGRYDWVQDEARAGASARLMGVRISLQLNAQRILYKESLQPYPSTQPLTSEYHTYCRLAADFIY